MLQEAGEALHRNKTTSNKAITRVAGAISAANAEHAKQRSAAGQDVEFKLYPTSFGGRDKGKSMECMAHVCRDSAKAQEFDRCDRLVLVQNNHQDTPCVALMTAINNARSGDHFIVITRQRSLQQYQALLDEEATSVQRAAAGGKR